MLPKGYDPLNNITHTLDTTLLHHHSKRAILLAEDLPFPAQEGLRSTLNDLQFPHVHQHRMQQLSPPSSIIAFLHRYKDLRCVVKQLFLPRCVSTGPLNVKLAEVRVFSSVFNLHWKVNLLENTLVIKLNDVYRYSSRKWG